jgi:hypothetical protein
MVVASMVAVASMVVAGTAEARVSPPRLTHDKAGEQFVEPVDRVTFGHEANQRCANSLE